MDLDYKYIEYILLYQMVDYPLSDSDILRIANSPPLSICKPFQPNILTYTQLDNVEDIDDILSADGTCIILFQEQSDNSGHWVSCFKRGNTICFYDPYGVPPDMQKTYLSGSARERYYQYPVFGKLLVESPYRIDYNDVQVQQDGSDIATCGRHNILRIWCRNMSNSKFIEWLRQRVSNTGCPVDVVATLLTNHLGV